MTKLSDADKKIILPNMICQVLTLQKEIAIINGDENLIGNPTRIWALSA